MPEANPPKTTRRWPFLALGASAFAVLMTVGPIVATRGVDAGGSGSDHAGYNVGMMAARAALAVESAVDRPQQPAAPLEPVSPEPVSPEPVAAPAAIESFPVGAEEPAAHIEDDAIDVGLALTETALVDGATATWEITITNQGTEYLWGVYAYLEGFGEVPCRSRQLDIGASTTCSAEQIVWEGDTEAIAWATAWTTERMTEDETSLAFTVAP
ncbi:MAG: hypothetical protein KJ698_06790 [Actinobacteria bacterium]|nr:hypothetical protein [Actinomycetota bacterium]MBU1866169.1 hypothetical protein [Actinomycetota bacterium]